MGMPGTTWDQRGPVPFQTSNRRLGRTFWLGSSGTCLDIWVESLIISSNDGGLYIWAEYLWSCHSQRTPHHCSSQSPKHYLSISPSRSVNLAAAAPLLTLLSEMRILCSAHVASAALQCLHPAPVSHRAKVIAGTVTCVLFTAWTECWELRRT